MISVEPVKDYIIENFLFGDENGFEDNTSFLQESIIDSIGMMELIDYLETHFDVKIEDSELIPENLDSLSNIQKFIAEKKE